MNKSFQECGVDEDYYWSIIDQIGMRAYEDQCAPANPRIPQIEDMKATSCASSVRAKPLRRKLPSAPDRNIAT